MDSSQRAILAEHAMEVRLAHPPRPGLAAAIEQALHEDRGQQSSPEADAPGSGGWYAVSFRFRSARKVEAGLDAFGLANALIAEIHRQQPLVVSLDVADAVVEQASPFYYTGTTEGGSSE